ncbi:MAG: serine acetyltransferase [Deltaproteobacteria bacterium]|nr:serine acetyltransferase [Deltaproteobacteria bacterium]
MDDRSKTGIPKGVFDNTFQNGKRMLGLHDNILNYFNELNASAFFANASIPDAASVARLVDTLKEIVFPGHFASPHEACMSLERRIGSLLRSLLDMLADQIVRTMRHDCLSAGSPCDACRQTAYTGAGKLLNSIPRVRRVLQSDVQAFYEGDPAAKSHDEIIFCYPGFHAIFVYRFAHRLHGMGVPLLPRIMTEYAHGITGIDIHPGARIGEGFVIDHGTGVVIGETTRIGKNVRIYQGVTIGALSVPKDQCDSLRGKKRHPTIGDDVIIYSGATILGGKTFIGARSVIGGNVWITRSVRPDSVVMMEPFQLKILPRDARKKAGQEEDGHGNS